MDISSISDDELRECILALAKENQINKVHGCSIHEIVDDFLSYTPLGRKIILDWYSGLEKTKNKFNWIQKTGFEEMYFTISGTEALVAMMLCGFRVNEDRCANVAKRSMEKLDRFGTDNYLEKDFFERTGLQGKDINKRWI